MFNISRVSSNIGGKDIIIETGHMARQAHGAVTVQCGGTVVFVAVVAGAESDQIRDFFPLTVDYRERTYAAGKIPGGYFKRESKPTEKETLTSRLIDRPIRPLFPEGYQTEVQISAITLSFDGENPTEILAMIGASAALLISDIPYTVPLSAVRVGMIDGKLIINPTQQELDKGDLDLVIAGTPEKVVMIEAGSKEISEEKMFEAIKFGHEAIKQTAQLQLELMKKAGKPKKAVKTLDIPAEITQKVNEVAADEFQKAFGLKTKEEQEGFFKQLYEKVMAQIDTKAEGFNEIYVKIAFSRLEHQKVREYMLATGKRADGRGERDIRQIKCEAGMLPRTHGSSLFTRGQTQSLSVVTLGTGDDEQRIDALEGEQTRRFMLHYNFPSYSVGECKPNRGPGRREIGHGALAARALEPVIPFDESFPYTVRLVSEIMESNGSSSMATVCGGTLALMDAGVPIKAPVAGIAIGLVTDKNRWKVLTDIAGIEDHLGDMDFKAAGTRKGLTALQMDLKIDGITDEILKEAFDHAKQGRFKILDMIQATISAPKELSMFAPRITTLRINPEKIGALIGPGGKNIRKIVEETGAKIDIEDDGRVFVAAVDGAVSAAAIARIQGCTAEAEVGKIYENATVQKLMPFGAFCEILPDLDGLCHVSEIADGFVKSPGDYMRVGDKVTVKVLSVDERGKISLSIKAAVPGGLPILPEDQRVVVEADDRPPRRGGRDRDRGGRGGRDHR
ncbi:MAG TPA: polyribonucleotide nucleotidyltransferase [Candidatus Omnitrophota bacterium]|jgi:polyribonucleotide nucleotidyltransferase|nr:polyribonucleotide nucleotidyltransferase [Candidatus Omnitrophota bacterium]